MNHYETSWKSFDGLILFSQTWLPDKKPKAIINLIHGLGEHSSRYNGWSNRFTDEGYIIRSFDMRGHGRSEGIRGHSSDYRNLIMDLSDFVSRGKEEFPALPEFIYGHSLGGNLVLNYAIENLLSVRGLIITSPWLELTHKPSSFIFGILSVLGRLMPSMLVNNGLDIKHISRDENEIEKYKNDSLVHEKISLGLGLQIIESGLRAASGIHKVNVPLLVLHGSDDEITSCRTTRNFVRHAGEKTTYIEFEGGYHELHNDIDNRIVFRSIIDWLEKQL
jgi:acylglycerol lipase